MRNNLRVVIAALILLVFNDAQAQFGYPTIITDTSVTVPCGQTCTNLTASALGGALTTSYTVSQIAYTPPFAFNSGTNVLDHTDDLWTSSISLPFNFCFFGNTFDKIIVGSNGEVSFNTQNAAAFNNWDIPGAAPFTSLSDQFNTVMAPWQDLDPTHDGAIYYNIGGVAPNRYFEVSWYECPMYGDVNSVNTAYCTNADQQTQMAVLYETTNIVEVYIQNKVVSCDNKGHGYWNGGLAIEGIMNGTGTVAYTVPGRNATQWTATDDAWRFTPAGTPSVTINWYKEPAGTLVGTGDTIQVCPSPGKTHYLVSAIYHTCGSTTDSIGSNVFVGLSNLSVADSAEQPSCASGNGAVFAHISSSTGIISYGWAPNGANDTTLTNIPGGTYVFTAEDSFGCVKHDTEVLSSSGPFTVTVANDTATSCTGTTNNGILNAVVSGAGTFTYSWTGGATSNPVTGLGVGTYTVTVTSSNGCTGTASASVSVSTHPLSFATPLVINVSCNGGNNGQIIAPLNGGTNPITYTWSPGSSTSDTLSNLTAGTYHVTAVDANNCSATDSFTITQPLTAVLVTVANDTVSSCAGLTNIGSLTAQVAGGTPSYSYKWSNNETINPVTGLASGTYLVTVDDVYGCSATASGTVVVKTSSLSVTVQVSSPICAGLKGTVVATETGGVFPVNYDWSTGRNVTDSLTTDTLLDAGGGALSITVTDANSCSVSASFNITLPTPVVVTVPNDTINTCSGITANGSLTASSTGGTPGYTYVWGNSATTATITGLAAGTYQVTATDTLGCTALGSGSVVIISNPITFNTPQIINASCSGANNGEIILSTSGGTAPITFTWSGGTTEDDTLRGLAGGTYNITATGANGCSATASYNVTQASPIVFGTPVITKAGCNGGNGSITVTSTGGTGTVTYAWSNGTTGATVTGPAGGYIVTATDASGCTASAAYSIGQAAPVAIDSADVVSASCTIDSGSIAVYASGGTGTLTYTWTPGNLTGNSIIDLVPGGYTVTVTDANSCSTTAYYIVGHSSCGGCPAVNTNNNVTIPCSQTCTQLLATAFSGAQTTAYTVAQIPYTPPFVFNTGTIVLDHTDDLWSSAITLPFNFCFWGVAHNQVIVGSNGEISFNVNNAGAFNNWDIPGPVPFTNANTEPDQKNTIMAPWQDLDPTNAGNIYYNISGTAPCRKFEVAWYDCPMFGDSLSVDNGYCTHLDHQTQMVVLYETTNAIDIYIQNKEIICKNEGQGYWNGGLAIEGIVNPTGLGALTVPGRNATQWTATDDAWRFTPNGAANYTVQWFLNGNSIATTDTVTVCPSVPTTYTVQATYTNCDNSQVVVADSVYVTPGGTLTATIDSTHAIQCYGDSDGAVYASYTTNGTITSFGWNTPGGANQTSVVGLPAGTYVFTVTTTTCSKSDTVVLTNPSKVAVSLANDTFTSCTTNNLGTLTAAVSGGAPGYTYSWSNGESTATVTGLTPGNYSVTVTDSHGCTGSATATVTRINGNLAFSIPIITQPTCIIPGGIIVGVTGGTAPITYSWSPTEPNTDTLTGLSAGSYCVTATDAGGCSVTACFTLNAASSVVIDSTHVTNLTCNGAANGSIVIYESGGALPITYTWSPTEVNTDSLAGLSAGTYSVTITDRNGCTATATYTITQPSPIANDSLSVIPVSCSASGSVVAYDTGGVAPLSYHWSNGSTTDSISNVQAGTYTLTVTDAHGCSITASYTVGTAPGALVFGPPVIVNTSCNGGSTGSITVSVTGGHGTITYVWSSPPGGTTDSITGLAAGVYTVTATDSLGCSASASYTVVQPQPIVFGTPVISQPTCNGGGNGIIVVTAIGGTGHIVYNWSNNDTGDSATGLASGVYCVTATDSVGCSASICYNVNQPAPVLIDSSKISAITCVASGQVILYVSGGSSPYTYSWSGATGGDTATVSSSGTVTVTVTDDHGCSTTGTFTVGAAIGSVTFGTPVISPVICNGNANGSITAVATDSSGGPITYAWSNSATGATISGLIASTYCVTATDSLGCTASACYTLAQPAQVTFGSPVIVPPVCYGDTDGSITASATGGTGTITYVWTGLVAGATDSDLAAGTYSVTATDSLGCSATALYNLGQPAQVTASGTVDSITCNGAANGSITAVGGGGTGPYTYGWTNGATTATISGLGPDNYCVTVTDSHGCTASTCFMLSQPPVLLIDSAAVREATCLAGGSVVVTVSGGTPGYSYSWSSNASTTDSAGNVAAGNITVTVTDHNACTVTATYTVPADTNVVVIDSAHIVNDICHSGTAGSIVVTASGGTGTLHYTWSTPPGGSTDNIINLAAGSYSITVTDSLGCKATAQYTISQPSAIVVIVDSTQVTCTSLGSVYVIASGGTGTFTYAWAPPLSSTSDSVGGLNDGTYTVTVTDQNTCTASGTGTVTTAPNSIVLALNVTDPLCNGSSNGSLTVVASGGAGGFTYQWSTGATTAAITSIVAGTQYCVTVHDANGCSKDTCYTLSQPAVLVITGFVNVNATCNSLGSIEAIVAGGTTTYNYAWSTGPTSNPITGLVGGAIESVTVTDAHGCTASDADTLAPAPLPLSIIDSSITPVLCHGLNTGAISVTIAGGVPNATITYTWSPAEANSGTISNLAAGTYFLTASEAGGCILFDSFTIVQPGPFSATIDAAPLVCPGASDLATAVNTGGTGLLSYTWSNQQNGNPITVTGLTTTPTSLTVTVTDANNCTATATTTVAAAPQIVADTVNVPRPCEGGDSVAINATGGTGQLTYSYAPGGTSNTTGSFGIVPTGTYEYSVTDTLGCSVSGSFYVPPILPAPVDSSSTDSTSCFGFSDGSITVYITNDSAENAPFTYSINGGPFGTSNVFDSLAAGIYQITIHTALGCDYTLADTVGQPHQIMVSFSPDTIQGYANTPVVLQPNINYATNPVYLWAPATGSSCTTCPEDSATITVPTWFYVTVSDSANPQCAVTDSVLIYLQGPLIMPSAFAPDGSVPSDMTFGPISITYVIVKEFHIYNRWGQLVHNGTDYWDGKFDGKPQPAGTYIYYIEGQYENPSVPGQYLLGKAEGAVTLLR